MKRSNLVIIAILLFSVVNMWGMAKNKVVEPQDTMLLRLFETQHQKLQINCTNLGKRIYFISDIVISKADLEAGKSCFILNSDFIITDVTINDVSIPIRKYRNVNSAGFEPKIDPELFKQFSKNVSVYEFAVDDLENAPEQVEIRLKYHIVDRESNVVYKNFKDKLVMRGLDFWYPRNLNKDETVLLTVKTTDQIAFSVNTKAVNYTRPKRFLKEYRTTFTDLKREPSMIIFMKKS